MQEEASTVNIDTGNVCAVQKMSTEEYYRYRSAIRAANDANDKEALRQIQKQLIARFGLDNDDVGELLKIFRFSV